MKRGRCAARVKVGAAIARSPPGGREAADCADLCGGGRLDLQGDLCVCVSGVLERIKGSFHTGLRYEREIRGDASKEDGEGWIDWGVGG